MPPDFGWAWGVGTGADCAGDAATGASSSTSGAL
ncbi:ATP synthase subunit E [Roseovarius sp. 217]|nr:ATP synthase subunit E [Roseovarius sp. 217]